MREKESKCDVFMSKNTVNRHACCPASKHGDTWLSYETTHQLSILFEKGERNSLTSDICCTSSITLLFPLLKKTILTSSDLCTRCRISLPVLVFIYFFSLSLSEQPVVPRFSFARRVTQFDLFVCESHCFFFFFSTSWCAFNISLSGKSPASPCNNFLKRQPPSVSPPAPPPDSDSPVHRRENRLRWIIADWILLVRLCSLICSHFRRFASDSLRSRRICSVSQVWSAESHQAGQASLSDEGASVSSDWWLQSLVMNRKSFIHTSQTLGYSSVSLFCDIFEFFHAHLEKNATHFIYSFFICDWFELDSLRISILAQSLWAC